MERTLIIFKPDAVQRGLCGEILTRFERKGIQVVGIKAMIASGDTATAWHLVMAATLLAMLPPLVVVVAMQRWFVRGLVDAEK